MANGAAASEVDERQVLGVTAEGGLRADFGGSSNLTGVDAD